MNAGLYLERGRLQVGFVRDRAQHERELRFRLRRPDLLKTFDADYSEQELTAVQERITDDLMALRAELGVNSVGGDVKGNRVSVTLGTSDPEAPARARAALAERYGAAVKLEKDWTIYSPLPRCGPSPPG